MNYAIVLRLLSYILYCEAALLLLPAMASLIYGEWMVLGVFLLTAALSAVAGVLLLLCALAALPMLGCGTGACSFSRMSRFST